MNSTTKYSIPATSISGEFNDILINFATDFLIYPTFYVEIPSFHLKWGRITLPRFPSKKLKDDELFYLLTSLAYHGISPATHLNELLIRTIAAKEFNVGWKSTLARVMSFLFSLFESYTELLKRKRWQEYAVKALNWLYQQLKSEGLQFIIKKIIVSITKNQRDFFAIRVNSILNSEISIKEKAKKFFGLIKEYVPKNQLLLEQYEVEALPFVMHGGEWKLGETSTVLEIEKIDQKAALEIARLIDRGFLPAPSSKLKMKQKFRSDLRSVVRLTRKRLIRIIESRSKKEQKLYGFRIWHIDDDERILNIEISAECFGKVIPEFSTLAEIKKDELKGHIELIIDTSSSMIGEPLEKAIDIAIALVDFAKEKNFSIGLITFSSGAWQGLKPSRDYLKAKRYIACLDAEGGTNIRGAIPLILKHLDDVRAHSCYSFIITDSAIYDIDKDEVKQGLQEVCKKSKLYFVIIGDIFWDPSKKTLSELTCKTFTVSLQDEVVTLRI